MNISIFGLGYVGAVCAACLSARGHTVLGVDISPAKIDLINQGKSPIVEPGLEALLLDGVSKGRLRGTTDVQAAIFATDLSLLCVGTPSKKNGDLDLVYMEAVCREIGTALRDKAGRHTVVVRSTVLPGTVKNVVIPILEAASGKKAGEDFGVAVNPEFLRESTAIKDYDFPAMTVIGELDSQSGDLLASLYEGLDAPVIRKSVEVAEMIKYTCNVWHATKVSFANEIGNIAKASGVDGREVMDVVCQDYKLNLSRYYLRPGFAFGGSCLPKDVRALTYRASQLDVEHPLLASIMASNRNQVQNALDLIERQDKRKIALLGLAFKAGSDDLRESPLVELAERLIGKGYDLRIFDANVEYARVFGANRDYIESKIPHVSSLLHSDLDQVIDDAEVIVLGNNDARFAQALEASDGKRVIDLVGFMPQTSDAQRQGICW
ncbi:UDP-glucose/GDP-mannose dehydrogenase family protein [Pseudomonas sp. SWI6]|uniref:GDP-mannose 6-dehydrogenase n=1 Tax=Pseudomonas taiwanensis TaxID=470150 RepID=A0ABR6V144_9PSED|nr:MULTISPECIES: UDP-glucose/GDP-mannose dehydrogenase family protein [Pseudomonas]AVD82606.1 UDP-glucose/GDP-mannose dehydrogenase family protein [Pseudomonas sp. SWI6]AVD89562.1 UDP-glucose/GDP-mannose dehydrogenase family protein [Pseudomonas sp. SWI44]MBC3474168.1 UDP-glucose/GDP-mannose dehydrogenase family protein [Pseudomonas taiwanensis]MBC3492321.1 UDP-glucose/GDP-mannose dehydrogenase family protein [Pseudomonas taiwanensis]MDT8924056.1 UDP-glucose/GDP-mannose dehydrogenase family pr